MRGGPAGFAVAALFAAVLIIGSQITRRPEPIASQEERESWRPRPSPSPECLEPELALYCPGEIRRVDDATGDIYLRRLDVYCPDSKPLHPTGHIDVSASQCDTMGEILTLLEKKGIRCQLVPYRQAPRAIAAPMVLK